MLGFAKPDDYRLAGELLRSGEYTYESVCNTLGGADWVTLRPIDLPKFARRVREPTPHNTLVQLFLLGEYVSVEQARQALRPMALETWIEAGLVRLPTPDSRVSSAVRLTPLGDLVVAADCPWYEGGQISADFVMPPGGTSLQLGWAAIPRPSGRTLDLGTGSGYLGLVAAPFSKKIVATDRNERAVAMARLNAMLNGIDEMESRLGDLWDPVRGERFDLVLSNPPFVITPEARLIFRDSGMRGDEFCRRLIREVPAFLEDGAYCQMLGNFAHRRGEPWREKLSSWFDELGCDVVVLSTRRESIEEYAMLWITTTESQDVTVVPRLFDAWMEYYEREQLEQVTFLLINLRRRNRAPNWTYIEEDLVTIVGSCGDRILTRFALLDYLAELASDERLLDECLVLDPHARVVQEHAMTGEGPKVTGNRLELRGPLRGAAQLDANVLRLLVECDGRRPLRIVLQQLAASYGLDEARLTRMALPLARHLLERGFLVPVRLVGQHHVE